MPGATTRLALLALLTVVSLAALGAPAARAADRQVMVVDNSYVVSTIAVKPGDTVTWTITGGNTHNVHFNDGLYTFPASPMLGPWMAMRTFPDAGEYRYHCDLHGPAGMQGLVYVNATGTVPRFPPYASFTVVPGVATPGQNVVLNAGPSSDSDGRIVRYQWDFDGNGSYETDGGSQSTTTTSFATAGSRTIGLQVTDSDGLTHSATQELVVTDPPTASLTVSPAIAQIGETVSFDGSASSDPDGTIARYEWDLDGNGSYEVDGETPTTSRTYASAAALTISLRVSDNVGIRVVARRPLQIAAPTTAPPPPPAVVPAPPPPAAVPTPPPPPAAGGCDALTGAARTTCLQKPCGTLSAAKRATCIAKSCKYVTGAKRASCIQTSCRYVAKGKRTNCNRASCRYLTGARRTACTKKYARKP